MRILVMADSHGEKEKVNRIVSQNIGLVDVFVHLGDGIDEFVDVMEENINEEDGSEVHNNSAYYYVVGNHEGNKYKWNHYEQTVIDVEGHRILLTHGEKENVKLDLFQLKYIAIREKCDIALFGHTHIKCDETADGVRMINPGAVTYERDGSESYAVLEISEESVETKFIAL